jgi:AraC-like DNA-binding protein
MDPLTDLFDTIHVSRAVQTRTESAPWSLLQEPDAGRAYFVHVARGNALLSIDGMSAPLELTGGDYVLIGPNTRYALGGSTTTLIYGWFALDPASRRAFGELLPHLVHVAGDQATLKLLASELAAPGPGSEVVVSRLADILLVQALRAFVATGHCTEPPRLLKALTDPYIGKSLQAIHGAVSQQWTLATLASAAGMSRSAFAARFKALVGETPLEYLTRWRMQTAARLLRTGKSKLQVIASAVGYHTDAAFTRAFRRVHGVSPGEYRRLVRLPQLVDGAGGVVGNEKVAGGIDGHADGSAPGGVGVGPSGHEVDRVSASGRQ